MEATTTSTASVTIPRVSTGGDLNANNGPNANDVRRQPVPAGPLMTFDLPTRQVIVRELCEADTRVLEWQGGADLRSWYEEQWTTHRAGASCVLVADFNRFPIGQIVIQWQGKPTHPHVPDLQSFRVFPAFQGLGIGSRLLQASEQVVEARGFAQVSLAVTLNNAAARRLYERMGYEAVGEPYIYIWHYVNAGGQTVNVEEHVVDLIKTFAPKH